MVVECWPYASHLLKLKLSSSFSAFDCYDGILNDLPHQGTSFMITWNGQYVSDMKPRLLFVSPCDIQRPSAEYVRKHFEHHITSWMKEYPGQFLTCDIVQQGRTCITRWASQWGDARIDCALSATVDAVHLIVGTEATTSALEEAKKFLSKQTS